MLYLNMFPGCAQIVFDWHVLACCANAWPA
jgi:hypothetical protein